jgi:hypothetical protein
MRDFITTYLATVTRDPRSAYRMLTPSFQRASGGYGGYDGFWSSIRRARPYDIVARPGASTISYAVDYAKMDGEKTSDRVTLQLVSEGSSYLIAGEL